MKLTDKIRRAIFKISAEGASYFEWSIWATILSFMIGLPIIITVLESFIKGFLTVFLTAVILFLISFIYINYYLPNFIFYLFLFDLSLLL